MPKKPLRYRVFENPDSASAQVAAEMAQLIRERAVLGRNAVIGLATGKTQKPLFEELIYLYREEGLSFKNVIFFQIDEYLGLDHEHPQSFRSMMRSTFFDHIDIPDGNVHCLRGDVSEPAIEAQCDRYEQRIAEAGGIDLLILGIGRNGHIGFNEPGSPVDARTGPAELAKTTREDAVVDFGVLERVPKRALTLGGATLLEARRIILMAWGQKKASIIRRALTGPITPKVPASYLKTHPSAQLFLDHPAAALLVAKKKANPVAKKGPSSLNDGPGIKF